ncbi:hypothetical protein ACB092_01G204200 [Castanea dentata]
MVRSIVLNICVEISMKKVYSDVKMIGKRVDRSLHQLEFDTRRAAKTCCKGDRWCQQTGEGFRHLACWDTVFQIF